MSTIVSIITSTSVPWTLPAGDGPKSVYARFTDNDLNTSLSVIGSITLDTVPPVTTPSIAGGTYPTNQAVTFTTSEPATVHYTMDGTDPLLSSPTYTAPLLVTSGTTTLKFFAVDLAGNAEAFQTQVYIIDLNAPLISNVTPTTGAFVNTADVSYTLNKLMMSGSVIFSPTGGVVATQQTYTMIPADLTAGPHSVRQA